MSRHPPLRGRQRECEALDRLLEAVHAGQSRALVVRGEVGVGKTALLDHLCERASGCRVARVSAVESEMELVFAGLHQLCAPMLDRLPGIPAPQRDALGTAFGLSAGDPPGRFVVGLALLSLLSEVAEERPFVCLIDDAHWLDRASAQALAFAARRLLAESVALVFAVRANGNADELAGLPRLDVAGLREPDARAVLASVLTAPMDARVRDRFIAETRGNPLALSELARALTPAELAGGFALPDARPLATRIEQSFRRRLETLPLQTRRLLLVAAAEPVGDPVLLWRAAERLGLGVEVAAPAITAGLFEVGAQVRFHHPLVRSAVYRAASTAERRRAHRALAEVTDPEVDPDRRAWHRANAAAGPDEDVADELERAATSASARGGLAAAAEFLERAATLTPDPARQAPRALAAAAAKHLAGANDAAARLLEVARAGPLDELHRTRVDVVHAHIAFSANRSGSEAPAQLLAAARRLEPLDARLAREVHLDALSSALFAGRFSGHGGLLELAEAARAAPASPQPSRAADALLDGLALLVTEGHLAAAPTLRAAVCAFRGEELTRAEGLRWLWVACHAAALLWDYESWDALSARQIAMARDAGVLTSLPIGLSTRAGVQLLAGDLVEAASLIEDVDAITAVTRFEIAPYAALTLMVYRGSEAEASVLVEDVKQDAVRRGEGLTFVNWAIAVLDNSLGRYESALSAAERAARDSRALWFSTWGLVELIEAATRRGKLDQAASALARLSPSTQASGTDWALGIEARSRALMSDGEAADRLYCEAIERLDSTRLRVELARAHLLYGEWLRRGRRRLDAREHLRTAHQMFTGMRIEAFARRAESELLATGETARRRTVETSNGLTAQEAQIARLARDGGSNPEIGARLFISPRTVEYHLHKVFGKLDIRSRSELDQALGGELLDEAASPWSR